MKSSTFNVFEFLGELYDNSNLKKPTVSTDPVEFIEALAEYYALPKDWRFWAFRPEAKLPEEMKGAWRDHTNWGKPCNGLMPGSEYFNPAKAYILGAEVYVPSERGFVSYRKPTQTTVSA